MDNSSLIGGVSTVVSSIMTASQANPILQYVQVGITILCGVCTLISIIRKWYQDAKKDGKITKDELKDLHEKINDEISKVKKDEEDK